MSDLDPKHVNFAKSLLTRGFSDADVKFELTSAGVDPSEANRYLTRAQWGLKSDADLLKSRQMQSISAMAIGGGLLACSYLTAMLGGLTIIAILVGFIALIMGAVLWVIYRLFPSVAMWLEHHFGYVTAAIVVMFFLVVAGVIISQL